MVNRPALDRPTVIGSPGVLGVAVLTCALGCPSTKPQTPPVDPATRPGPVTGTRVIPKDGTTGLTISPDTLRREAMQRDTDGDGVDDHRDNCTLLPNPDQTNQDQDARGDLCDACPNESGNTQLGCPHEVRPTERITRDEWRARHTGQDWDEDGIPMPQDNCPLDANPKQDDADGDGWGDRCDRCSRRPSPDTVDGCIDGDRWAIDVAIEESPYGFCMETCALLETCQDITARFPGKTGALIRVRCERMCQEDPEMQRRIIDLGRPGTISSTSCRLDETLSRAFRPWDLFACDQLYCDNLQTHCPAEFAEYGGRGGCVEACLGFDRYHPNGAGERAHQGINCLVRKARSARSPEECAEARVARTSCPPS